MKSKALLVLIGLVIAVNVGLLNAGEVIWVRSFQTWDNVSESGSTDPAGIVYHNGHLFISDSEIDEIAGAWDCKNIFEVSLAGDQVFNAYDSYVNNPVHSTCLGDPEEDKRDREPTGITYNEYDDYFYVTNDDRTRILRYDPTFGEAIGRVFVQGADLEDITSDPLTGYLYAVVGVAGINGDGISRVLVYNSNLEYQSEFSVDDRATDPEGIAYNQQLNHLFLVSQADMKIFEYTLSGDFVDDYDITTLDPAPIDPQGLTFAPPSSDPTSNNLNLYIVDGRVDNGVDPTERDGIVYEVDVIPTNDFLANSLFKTGKHGNSGGNVCSNGNIEFARGLPSTFTGNLSAVGDITIGKDNTVNGNVTAGGILDINSNATVTGTATGNAPVATVVLPVVSFSAGGADVQLQKNEILSLAPGSYGNVHTGNGSTLRLSSGQYYFETMDLQQSTVLEADVSGGAVTMNVSDSVIFHKNARVDIIGEGGSHYFTLRQASNKKISVDNGASFQGSIIAPLAKVTLNKDAEFEGSIIADVIEVGRNASLNPHSAGLSLAKMSVPETETGTPESISNPIPSAFSLSQNYPNPFNPETRISFQLPTTAHVVMRIYNARGQEILKLLDNTYAQGTQTVRWDGKDSHGSPVPSGIYFYRLQAGEFIQVKKMTLLK